jgi:Leucine-rich repeat (LRR) protein
MCCVFNAVPCVNIDCVHDTLTNTNRIRSIKLIQCALAVISDSLFEHIDTLIELDVSQNLLTSLPDTLARLAPTLTFLHIGSNQMQLFPSVILSLTRLDTLIVCKETGNIPNYIQTLPSQIDNLTNLTHLSLQGCAMQHLPSTIGTLSELNVLDLSDMPTLVDLPDSIGDLHALTTLQLLDTSISVLPDSIGSMSSLLYLYLDYTHVQTLPKSIGQLPRLQAFTMRHCALQTLPESIVQITSLYLLNLQGNALTSLPSQIGNLVNLRQLDVSHNDLHALPDSIGNLYNLTELSVDSNPHLQHLPESIGSLHQLLGLDASDCGLKSIPASITSLRSLYTLSLSQNSLTSIPQDIGKLSQLQMLEVGNNQLTHLPSSIGELSELTSLDVQLNHLTCIPESVCNLQKLYWLWFGSNQVTHLPSALHNMTSLKRLEFEWNRISTWPQSVLHMSQVLDTFVAANNQLTELPPVHAATIDVTNNSIVTIPDTLCTVNPSLNTLAAGYNRIKTVSESIKQCQHLNVLRLEHNQLATFPAAAISQQLNALSHLDLSHNHLYEFELLGSLSDLPSLLTLILDGNHLSVWPNIPGSLQVLSVAYNNLQSMPARLQNSASLIHVNASHNNISSVFQWSQWQVDVLDLSYNKLAQANVVNALAAQARFIYLSHNRMTQLPFANALPGGESEPRLRLLDISYNAFGTNSLNSDGEVAKQLSWSDMASAFQYSNAALVNMSGSPFVSRILSGMPNMCDDSQSGAFNSLSDIEQGCFVETQADTDADNDHGNGNGGDDSTTVQCSSLLYVGPQAWGQSQFFKQAYHGQGTPGSVAQLIADPSMLAFNSCTIPAQAYPIFPSSVLELSTRRDMIVIPDQLLGNDRSDILPAAAPRCPDIGYEINACGTFSSERSSINYWSCNIEGHDPYSYMCSRCFADEDYVKNGARCIKCQSFDKVTAPLLWIVGTVGFVAYIAYWASFSSYLVSTLIFHIQMLSFLSHGPVSWSGFVRHYLLSWVHAASADPTTLGCAWVDHAQTYRSALFSSLLLPVTLITVFTIVVIVSSLLQAKCYNKQTYQQQGSRQHEHEETRRALTLRLSPTANRPDFESGHEALLLEDAADDGEQSYHNLSDDSMAEMHASNRDSVFFASISWYRVLWFRLVLYMLAIVYPSLTLRIMQAFGSYEDPTMAGSIAPRLAADLEIEYGGHEWASHILPYGLLGLLIYVIGIPVLLWLAVRGRLGQDAQIGSEFLTQVFKSHSSSIAQTDSTSMLYRLVSPRSLALWMLLFKGMLSALVAITTVSSIVPMLFVVVLLVVLLLFISRRMPFVHMSDNTNSYLSLAVLVITYAAVALLSAQESSTVVSLGQYQVVSWLLVLVNFVFIVFVVGRKVVQYSVCKS